MAAVAALVAESLPHAAPTAADGVIGEVVSEAEAAASRFAPELERYGELIRNRRGDLTGFMVRGEDADFARRVRDQLAAIGAPDEALDQHAAWLETIGPRRAFMKTEWQAGPDGAVRRLAAIYHRRRLPTAEAAALIDRHAEGALPVGHFHSLARLLGKESVHFLSLACRPGEPVHYKLYFSQFQDAANHEAVRLRLARALTRFAPHRTAIDRWAVYHDRLAPCAPERSLFVSLAMTREGVQPSIKIDYPDVAPDVAVGLLDEADQEPTAASFAQLCAAADIPRLSFLGVRLGLGALPVLKGYADFP